MCCNKLIIFDLKYFFFLHNYSNVLLICCDGCDKLMKCDFKTFNFLHEFSVNLLFQSILIHLFAVNTTGKKKKKKRKKENGKKYLYQQNIYSPVCYLWQKS